MSLGTAPSKPSFSLLYWLKNLKSLNFFQIARGTRTQEVVEIWPVMRLFRLFSDTVTCTLLESWSFPSLYVIRIQGLFCMHAADKNKLRTINLVVLIEPFRTSVWSFRLNWTKVFMMRWCPKWQQLSSWASFACQSKVLYCYYICCKIKSDKTAGIE